jgi:hypothetical protein
MERGSDQHFCGVDHETSRVWFGSSSAVDDGA